MWGSIVADGVSKHICTRIICIGGVSKCTIVVVDYRTVGRLRKGCYVKVITLWVGVVAKYLNGYRCVHLCFVLVVIGNYSIFGRCWDSNNYYCLVASYGVAVVADGVSKHIGTCKVGIGCVGDSTVGVNGSSTVCWVSNVCNGKAIALWVGVVG